MRTLFQAINFSASNQLQIVVKQKMSKLDQFYGNIVDSAVVLKVVNKADIQNKQAEIKINLPGTELFAKKQCKTFEEATDMAVQALKKQIVRYKSRNRL